MLNHMEAKTNMSFPPQSNCTRRMRCQFQCKSISICCINYSDFWWPQIKKNVVCRQLMSLLCRLEIERYVQIYTPLVRRKKQWSR